MTRLYIPLQHAGAFMSMNLADELRGLGLHLPESHFTPGHSYDYFDVQGLTREMWSRSAWFIARRARGEVFPDFHPGEYQPTLITSEVDQDTVLAPVAEVKKRIAEYQGTDIEIRSIRGGRGRLTCTVNQVKVSIEFYTFLTPEAYSVRFVDAQYYRLPVDVSHRDVHLTGPGARQPGTKFAVSTLLTYLTETDAEQVFPAPDEQDEGMDALEQLVQTQGEEKQGWLPL